MMKKYIFYLFVAFFLYLSGYATAQTHETENMLNSRMYKMSYEEALQRFGPPSQCAESGKTRACTWIYEENIPPAPTPESCSQSTQPLLSFSEGAALGPEGVREVYEHAEQARRTCILQQEAAKRAREQALAESLAKRPTVRLTFINDVLTYWQLSGNWK